MNVHLTAELESLVHKKVQSGRYSSASEVVREALRLLQERDQLVEFRKLEMSRQIAEGIESLQRGQGIEGEEAFRLLDQRHQRFRRRRNRA